MSAPTLAVEWLLARAAVRGTGLLHVVSRRDSGALNPVCGARTISSEKIETYTRLDDVTMLCDGCGTIAASIGGTILDGVALLLGLSTAETTTRLLDIPVTAVHARPDHARRSAGPDIDNLVDSVTERGIVTPIVVRRTDTGFEIIDGARRLYAAQVAGLTVLPAVVRDTTDSDAVIDALVANIHRAALNPIEQAHAYQRALEVLDCSKAELGRRLSLDRSTISNRIRLLDLPTVIQEQIADGTLTEQHGRTLLSIKDPTEQAMFAERIVFEQLTAHVAADIARKTTAPREVDPQLADIAGLLTGLLAAKVKVTTTTDRARIVIDVPDTDLARILEQLGVATV